MRIFRRLTTAPQRHMHIHIATRRVSFRYWGRSSCTPCRDVWRPHGPFYVVNMRSLSRKCFNPSCHAQMSPCNRCKKHPFRFAAASNINPMDVPQELPHVLEDTTSILVVRRGICERFTDFNVSMVNVCNALRWLRESNPFYKEVIIDRKSLELLPINGSVLHILQIVADTNSGTMETILPRKT